MTRWNISRDIGFYFHHVIHQMGSVKFSNVEVTWNLFDNLAYFLLIFGLGREEKSLQKKYAQNLFNCNFSLLSHETVFRKILLFFFSIRAQSKLPLLSQSRDFNCEIVMKISTIHDITWSSKSWFLKDYGNFPCAEIFMMHPDCIEWENFAHSIAMILKRRPERMRLRKAKEILWFLFHN